MLFRSLLKRSGYCCVLRYNGSVFHWEGTAHENALWPWRSRFILGMTATDRVSERRVRDGVYVDSF